VSPPASAQVVSQSSAPQVTPAPSTTTPLGSLRLQPIQQQQQQQQPPARGPSRVRQTQQSEHNGVPAADRGGHSQPSHLQGAAQRPSSPPLPPALTPAARAWASGGAAAQHRGDHVDTSEVPVAAARDASSRRGLTRAAPRPTSTHTPGSAVPGASTPSHAWLGGTGARHTPYTSSSAAATRSTSPAPSLVYALADPSSRAHSTAAVTGSPLMRRTPASSAWASPRERPSMSPSRPSSPYRWVRRSCLAMFSTPCLCC
jgi:hypothetical protein